MQLPSTKKENKKVPHKESLVPCGQVSSAHWLVHNRWGHHQVDEELKYKLAHQDTLFIYQSYIDITTE